MQIETDPKKSKERHVESSVPANQLALRVRAILMLLKVKFYGTLGINTHLAHYEHTSIFCAGAFRRI